MESRTGQILMTRPGCGAWYFAGFCRRGRMCQCHLRQSIIGCQSINTSAVSNMQFCTCCIRNSSLVIDETSAIWTWTNRLPVCSLKEWLRTRATAPRQDRTAPGCIPKVAKQPDGSATHRDTGEPVVVGHVEETTLDLAWIAAGRFDAYGERDLSPWDLAAGMLLVREAAASPRSRRRRCGARHRPRRRRQRDHAPRAPRPAQEGRQGTRARSAHIVSCARFAIRTPQSLPQAGWLRLRSP